MRIRETKEVERKISFEKACVYLIADDDTIIGHIKQIADATAAIDQYVKNSCKVSLTGNNCTANIYVFNVRDMTPAEEMAWHTIKSWNCVNKLDPNEKSHYTYGDCKEILKGKEVIL